MKAAIQTLIFLSFIGSTRCVWATELPEPITLSEAEILIYLMPASQELRRQGFDVGWELERSSDRGPDSLHFWVYNAKRKCPEGCSVTIGSFVVDKRTAEVKNVDTKEAVTNQEIRGVQAILRREHHLLSKPE